MGAKILVVDDEQEFVELISFNLKKHGYEVVTASNGLTALSKARLCQPDALVLDLMMDDIDGFSVCEILRHQLSTKTIPVILVTAAPGEMARLNGLAAGADDFLSKPFPPAELVRRVEAVMESRRAQAAREAANE